MSLPVFKVFKFLFCRKKIIIKKVFSIKSIKTILAKKKLPSGILRKKCLQKIVIKIDWKKITKKFTTKIHQKILTKKKLIGHRYG